MSKATESMFDGKNVLIPLEEVSYVLKFQNCIEVRFKDSADSLTLAQPDKNAFISAWCRYRGEVEADTLMDLDGAQPAPSIPEGWKLVPVEIVDLYSFMCSAFTPMTPQQGQIAIQLDLAKRAMLTSSLGLVDQAMTRSAPSIPEGWLRAIDEALVVAHIGVANESDTYEQAKAKLDSLIGFHVDVATDPAVNGGYKLVSVSLTPKTKGVME